MGPEAQCLTRALKAPTPHEPVTRLAEQARRSASRSRRSGGSGGCWRGSAGPRGGWSRPGGNGRGHWPQPFAEGARSVLWPARGWSGRPGLRHNMPPNSGNKLLVFRCGCSVSDTHRNPAAEGGQLPGLPEERMPAGLVLIHGRAHGARIAAQPAEAAGARCTPPGQIAGLAAANAAAVTR